MNTEYDLGITQYKNLGKEEREKLDGVYNGLLNYLIINNSYYIKYLDYGINKSLIIDKKHFKKIKNSFYRSVFSKNIINNKLFDNKFSDVFYIHTDKDEKNSYVLSIRKPSVEVIKYNLIDEFYKDFYKDDNRIENPYYCKLHKLTEDNLKVLKKN